MSKSKSHSSCISSEDRRRNRRGIAKAIASVYPPACQIELLERRLLLSSYTVAALAAFNGINGQDPQTGVVMDSSGNLFGTTGDTVFGVARGSGVITTCASLNTNGGLISYSGVVLDSSDNFFGTTEGGGINYTGSVFEVAKGSGVTTLASYNAEVGLSYVAVDSSGNIFGATEFGGDLTLNAGSGYGSVFEIAKGSGVITTLASFNGTNGYEPSGVVLDSSGNLFGTTTYGGTTFVTASPPGDGSVFEIARGSGTITTLASFNISTNGGEPVGPVLDSSGNLFGTTGGAVFEVAKGSGVITTLASFNATDGGDSNNIVLDPSGDLFGTTEYGGSYGNTITGPISSGKGYGTVFEIARGSGVITTVASFNGTNGEEPYGSLVLDSSGNLFGATECGGNLTLDYGAGDGTVFEVTLTNTATTTAITSSNGSTTVGQSVTFTATVIPASGSGETGTVQFRIDGNNAGSPVSLSGNTATYTTLTLSAGSHSVVAVYSGDSNFAASTSPPLTQNVTNSGTTTAVASSGSPTIVGQSVTFTATVTPASGGGETGTVQFQIDGGDAGGPVPLSGNTATYTTSALSAGSNSIVAVYSGDNNFPGSVSPVFTQTVAPSSATTGAQSLAFTQQPYDSLANWAISPPIAVAVEDSIGNIVASENSIVSLSIATGPAGASLGGMLNVAAVDGIATFSNITASTPGTYTLAASDSPLTGAVSSPFTVLGSFATLTNGALLVTGTSGDDIITLTTSGGTLTATLNGSSVSFTLSQVASIDVEAGAGNDFVSLGIGVPSSSVQGGPGWDTIIDSSGDDTLAGGRGRDIIGAGKGNDLIRGGRGCDSLVAGLGNDTLYGGPGNDTIHGGPGNDVLDGGAGTNQIYGGQGSNALYAVDGTADQIFAASASSDSLVYSTSDSPIIESGSILSGNEMLA